MLRGGIALLDTFDSFRFSGIRSDGISFWRAVPVLTTDVHNVLKHLSVSSITQQLLITFYIYYKNLGLGHLNVLKQSKNGRVEETFISSKDIYDH